MENITYKEILNTIKTAIIQMGINTLDTIEKNDLEVDIFVNIRELFSELTNVIDKKNI